MKRDFSTNPPPPYSWKEDEPRKIDLSEIKSKRVKVKKKELSEFSEKLIEWNREKR